MALQHGGKQSGVYGPQHVGNQSGVKHGWRKTERGVRSATWTTTERGVRSATWPCNMDDNRAGCTVSNMEDNRAGCTVWRKNSMVLQHGGKQSGVYDVHAVSRYTGQERWINGCMPSHLREIQLCLVVTVHTHTHTHTHMHARTHPHPHARTHARTHALTARLYIHPCHIDADVLCTRKMCLCLQILISLLFFPLYKLQSPHPIHIDLASEIVMQETRHGCPL